MRLRAEIWVRAYLRICENGGATVTVVRHGDDDAGAVFIKLRLPEGHARVFGPAPAGLESQKTDRSWSPHLDGTARDEVEIDAYLQQQVQFDPDIWIVEVQDRDGRHFLDDWLARA